MPRRFRPRHRVAASKAAGKVCASVTNDTDRPAAVEAPCRPCRGMGGFAHGEDGFDACDTCRGAGVVTRYRCRVTLLLGIECGLPLHRVSVLFDQAQTQTYGCDHGHRVRVELTPTGWTWTRVQDYAAIGAVAS